MEDDIDIEEHDVLDNPKIRNLLPHLNLEFEDDPKEAELSEDTVQVKQEYIDDEYNEYIETYEETDKHTDSQMYEEAEVCDSEYILPDTSGEEHNNIFNIKINPIIPDNLDDNTNENKDESEPNDKKEPIITDIFYPNKIILGSKPKKLIPNEHNNPIVQLEDWSQILGESLSYCDSCQILFSTVNALDAHKMLAHSFLVALPPNRAIKSTTKLPFPQKELQSKNNARKSTGLTDMSTYCNHCDKIFEDHTSLIKHLYQLLPIQFACQNCDQKFNTQNELNQHSLTHILEAKSVQRPMTNFPEQPGPNKPKYKYRCVRCNAVGDGRTWREQHRLKSHPELYHRKIFAPIIVKSSFNKVAPQKILQTHVQPKRIPVQPKKVLASSVNAVPLNKDVDLIPKSTLFRCEKCNVHFLSLFIVSLHRQCAPQQSQKQYFTCKKCKNIFRNADKLAHDKQHECTKNFKVFNITNDLNDKVLVKCEKCNLHFGERFYKSHLINCGKLPSLVCTSCKIRFPKSKMGEHTKKHQKYKPRHFIIMEVVPEKVAQKRKLEAITQPQTSKMVKLPPVKPEMKSPVKPKVLPVKKRSRTKFDSATTLYYCKHCNRCMNTKKKRSNHTSRKCLKNCLSDTCICLQCGLAFTRKSMPVHLKRHKNRVLTLESLTILDVKTFQRIQPSTPKYPQCSKCKIKFFKPIELKEHMCGEDYETCEYCGDNFFSAHIRVHEKFHPIDLKVEKPKTVDSDLFHTMFLCIICNIATDTYDKCVEHSQNHLFGVAMSHDHIKCYICRFKIEDSGWQKHTEFHANKSSSEVKLFNFNPNDLISESWFQMFAKLPEWQINQIMEGSLYDKERSVKLRLVKPGRAEFTLYACSSCETCFDQHLIKGHLRTACVKTTNYCKICNVAFDGLCSLQKHGSLHQKGVDRKEFRIVSFDVGQDRKRVEMQHSFKTQKVKKTIVVKKTYKSVEKGETLLYKCKSCNVCLLNKYTAQNHKCGPKKTRIFCEVCNQWYPQWNLWKHKEKHLAEPDFNKDHIRVIKFKALHPLKRSTSGTKPVSTPPTKTSKKSAKSSKKSPKMLKTAKIYKCECGLHFTSLKMIETHSEMCSEELEMSKENCSKCSLLFPTHILVSHLCKHHSEDIKLIVEKYPRKDTENNDEISKESKSNPNTPTPDNSEQDTANSIIQKAEIQFISTDSNDIQLQTDFQEKPNSTSESSGYATRATTSIKIKHTHELFKCAPCDVYFLSRYACVRHVAKHKKLEQKEFIQCKLCNLQFRLLTLMDHMRKHHENEFNINEVVVEEYEPGDKPQANKKRYIYGNRIQSLQVSSSNDD